MEAVSFLPIPLGPVHTKEAAPTVSSGVGNDRGSSGMDNFMYMMMRGCCVVQGRHGGRHEGSFL